MELLGFLAAILGILAFFMTVGVRPRLRDLEEAKENPRVLQEIEALDRRLRDLERKLRSAAIPAAASDIAQTAEATGVQPEAPRDATESVPAEAPPVAAATPTSPPTVPAQAEEPAPDVVGSGPPIAPEQTPEASAADVPTAEAPAPEAPAPEAPTPEALEPAAPTEPPAPPPTAEAATEPTPEPVPRRSLEEAIGTRWTVWVGGAALALGAILLVRYSIERGFFGPGVRVMLGFVLAAALIGAGEFLRRRDSGPEEAVRTANIPGMLTATGTLAAFGTIYAAYALYHFIGTPVAFVALGATALACLALAALHGQAMAGLGLVGALVTPFLTPSDHPSPWPVVIYIGVVGAAAYGLAHLKQWLWLSLAAATGAGFWACVLLVESSSRFFSAAMTHIALQTAFAAAFLAFLPHAAEPEEESRLDAPASIVLAGAAALTILALAFGVVTGNFGWSWLIGAAAVAAILAATAVRIAAAASAIVAAGVLAIALLRLWPPVFLAYGRIVDLILGRYTPQHPVRFSIVALAGCIGIAGLAGARLLRARELSFFAAACYAAAAALTPLAGLSIAYLRFAHGAASLPLAFIAAAGALAFAAGGYLFFTARASNPSEPIRLGLGALASAAIAAAALALVFALEGGMLTVALALAAAGTALVAVRLELAALRWCVAALGILIGARLAWDPRIVGADLSTTPIFNWLLFGYGVPALSFAAAGRIMRAQGDDVPVRIADALAVLFSAFLVFFEIRHAMNGGDPFAPGSGLLEQGLLAVATFGFGFVLTRLDAAQANLVFRVASLAAGAIGMTLAIIGLGLRWNPLLVPERVEGGVILNALLLGYLLPGLLAGLLAFYAHRSRPAWYWGGAAAIALSLCLLYLVLEVRVLFHGQEVWHGRGATLAELGIHTTIFILAAAAIAWTLVKTAPGSRRDPAIAAWVFGHWALVVTAALGAVVALVGLGIVHNPLLQRELVAGGTILNALLPGYLLPALAAAALAYVASPLGERYWNAAAFGALILGLAYLLLETRVLFHGAEISVHQAPTLAELGIQTTICLLVAAAIGWLMSWIASAFLKQALLAVTALAAVLFVAGPDLLWNPLLVPEPVAGGAIFNALIPGYLLPALAGILLALVTRPLLPAFGQIVGLVSAAVALGYLVLEVRVLFHGPSIVATRGAGIAELGVDTSLFLALAIALMVGARLWQRRALSLAAMALSALAFVVGGVGLALLANPLFSGARIAGFGVFNTLVIGYGLPALLAFVLAREASRPDRMAGPEAFRIATGIAAIAFLFLFVTLETRRVFQGSVVGYWRATSEAEWYAYSAVWLVLGLVLLAYGLWRQSTTMRLASGLFVLASVAKVFLFDLAGLQGILRAASFIGLGLALIGIGLVYQKLVFARPTAPPPAAV